MTRYTSISTLYKHYVVGNSLVFDVSIERKAIDIRHNNIISLWLVQ